MAKKNFWLGMLVMVLAFGMTVVGCNNDPTDKSTSSSLNGTWIGTVMGSQDSDFVVIRDPETGEIIGWIDPWTEEIVSGEPPAGAGERVTEYEIVYKINNGNYEFAEDGIPFEKGTYTANNGILSLNPINIFCSNYAFDGPYRKINIEFEEGWYTKEQLKQIANESGLSIDEGDLDGIDEMFEQMLWNYSISGNKLTIVWDGEEIILTRK